MNIEVNILQSILLEFQNKIFELVLFRKRKITKLYCGVNHQIRF